MSKTIDEASIPELKAEIERRQKKLPRLTAQAEKLEKQLEAIRAEIAALTGEPVKAFKTTRAAGGGAKPKGGGGKRPQNQQSLSEVLLSVLSKEAPKTIKQIIEDIKAAGYQTTSNNFDTIVYQAISREKEKIEKVGRGLYKLKA